MLASMIVNMFKERGADPSRPEDFMKPTRLTLEHQRLEQERQKKSVVQSVKDLFKELAAAQKGE